MDASSLNERLINYFKLFLKYLSYLMVIVYLVLSFLLLFTNIYATDVKPFQRYALGGILLVYGIYRCFRLYKEQKTMNNENE